MNILLISIAFPPKRDPESLQVAKYCKYLSRMKGVNLEVVTSSNPTLYMDTDANLNQYIDKRYKIHEIDLIENRFVNFLLRKTLSALTQLPDTKVSFTFHRKIARKLNGKPDVLYSRSYPLSSTVLAYRIRKKLNIPWVLHLSDPWALSSTQSKTPATGFKGFSRRWNLSMEQKSFALADYICLTSEKTIDLYKDAYPQFAHKFFYAPNVYDDELFSPNPYVVKDKMQFVYTGGFGEARSPESFLLGIERFMNGEGSGKKNVEFVFTGEMTRKNKDMFQSFRHIQEIRLLGVIPYNDVLQLQRTADVLVNIDSDIKESKHSVFFPSKLLEYMSAQRRILAITNDHSTTHQVVHGRLGDCFSFTDIDGIVSFIGKAYKHYCDRDADFFKPAMKSIEEFSAEQNAERLMDLFQRTNAERTKK